jgi:RNA polymerase subunit RPABC4/transcription elongation factor Spt4
LFQCRAYKFCRNQCPHWLLNESTDLCPECTKRLGDHYGVFIICGIFVRKQKEEAGPSPCRNVIGRSFDGDEHK